MTWKYQQSTGSLSTPDGNIVGQGYSGNGEGLNNPAMQNVHDVGPIPQGVYTIGRFFDDPGGKGPIVAHLVPDVDTNTFGRSGFMVHGDNEAMNHSASHGCIILHRDLRNLIMGSSDRALEVVA